MASLASCITMQATLVRIPSTVSHKRGPVSSKRSTIVSALKADEKKPNLLQTLGSKAAALSLATLLSVAPLAPALASEFDVLAEDEPKNSYIIDDAGVLSKSSAGEINNKLAELNKETGYKVTLITLRKLEYDPDAFSFTEKILKKWYKTNNDDKGIVLVITAGKDGAVLGGDKFMNALGDDLIDGVVGGNIAVLTGEEKYNEAAISSVNRVATVLQGKADPGGPVRVEAVRKRTFRTKEETEKTKTVTGTVVATLLFIAVVVPMLQY